MFSCQVSFETLVLRSNFESLLRKRRGIILKRADSALWQPRGAGESSIGVFVDPVIGNGRINAAKEVSLQIRNVERHLPRVATPSILDSSKKSRKCTSRIEFPAVAQQPAVLILPIAGGGRLRGRGRDFTPICYDRSYRLRHDALPRTINTYR